MLKRRCALFGLSGQRSADNVLRKRDACGFGGFLDRLVLVGGNAAMDHFFFVHGLPGAVFRNTIGRNMWQRQHVAQKGRGARPRLSCEAVPR